MRTRRWARVLGAAGALCAALVVVMASATGAFEDPHGVGYDGHDWKAMSEPAKLAYIAGFLAGAATQQAFDRQRTNPKISLDAAVSELIQSHSGAFPFGANVYKNDLEDYYFYRDRLPTKIYRALVDENAHMLRVAPPK